MPKNPVLNAILAGVYIVGIVTLMNYLSHIRRDDSVVTPMVVLSLLTLSAAVMGYLFLSNPIMLYLDGKKKEAVTFFLKTLGSFAVITAVFLVIVLTGIGS